MKKNEYLKPEMWVVNIQHQHQLLAGSITDVNGGDTGIGIIGGGSDPACARILDDWVDWDGSPL